MICNCLSAVVYPVPSRLCSTSCTSRTVQAPCSHSTCRIPSSPSVGRDDFFPGPTMRPLSQPDTGITDLPPGSAGRPTTSVLVRRLDLKALPLIHLIEAPLRTALLRLHLR